MQKNKQSKKLTNRLPEWRARTKLTQSGQLAEKTGVSRQTIISIEKMKYTPSLALAFEIAQALSCSIDDVFQYNEENE
nr:helix-turn-helix transcriptional regulator [Bacillus subtilis]